MGRFIAKLAKFFQDDFRAISGRTPKSLFGHALCKRHIERGIGVIAQFVIGHTEGARWERSVLAKGEIGVVAQRLALQALRDNLADESREGLRRDDVPNVRRRACVVAGIAEAPFDMLARRQRDIRRVPDDIAGDRQIVDRDMGCAALGGRDVR
jgi:hypothetical protein